MIYFMSRVHKFLYTGVQHWSSNLHCFIKDFSSAIVSIKKLGLCLKVVFARRGLTACIRVFRPVIDAADISVVAHILRLPDENKNRRLLMFVL